MTKANTLKKNPKIPQSMLFLPFDLANEAQIQARAIDKPTPPIVIDISRISIGISSVLFSISTTTSQRRTANYICEVAVSSLRYYR